jgi:hypothetical protein
MLRVRVSPRTPKDENMKVHISVKHSDMCYVAVDDDDGNEIFEHDGYAPRIGCMAGGDYTTFIIDNETGQIQGWKPITKEELDNFVER